METKEQKQLLRDKDVAARLGISRCYVWKLTQEGRLPKPTKIASKMTVWRARDIDVILENPNLLNGSVNHDCE